MEKDIQTKKRATLEMVLDMVKSHDYVALGTTTVCLITLDNGYTVLGTSACVDPANFDKELGERLAYDDAVDKVWPLAGFRLAEGGVNPHLELDISETPELPPMRCLSFGQALNALEHGKRVARLGWNGKGMWLYLVIPSATSVMRRPFIAMNPVDGALVPWVASQSDLLCRDWEIVG